MSNLLSINGLEKIFFEELNPISAVKDLSFELNESEILVIFGRSGSGKTTLLHLIAGLENASRGSILFQNNLINKMSSDELSLLRRDNIGFVYQFHHFQSYPARRGGASRVGVEPVGRQPCCWRRWMASTYSTIPPRRSARR